MKAYEHFTTEERESLSRLLQAGQSHSEIARRLNRHRSSIGREIKRNTEKKAVYMPLTATMKYLRRRKRSKRRNRYETDKELAEYTKQCLSRYWSPEIITVKWKEEHPAARLSHTTIYRALEKKLLPGYSGFTHLRRRNKQKYVRKNSATIKPDHTIHERDEIANNRGRLGDWEGDVVQGGRNKGSVVTMADRKSRYYLAKLTTDCKSDTIPGVMIEMLSSVPVETITLDNGPEFARHSYISNQIKATIYFADPKSPWQRGTNENLNDVLRFFYPKGCDFTIVTQDEINATLELINTRPRKCLGWLSPKEVFLSRCCT
jgi:IS30 family transposase